MEPRKFFVKDFIKYATPCFGCGQPNNFCFGFTEKGCLNALNMGRFPSPIINDRYVELDLTIRYASNLKLFIFHKDNRILSSDDAALALLVDKRDILLQSYCNFCQTKIQSSPLELQLVDKVISPTTLAYENLEVRRGNKKYTLRSYFNSSNTQAKPVSLAEIVKFNNDSTTCSVLPFTIPLLPKYKLRDQEYLINKLNTYAIFS